MVSPSSSSFFNDIPPPPPLYIGSWVCKIMYHFCVQILCTNFVYKILPKSHFTPSDPSSLPSLLESIISSEIISEHNINKQIFNDTDNTKLLCKINTFILNKTN